MIRAFIPKRRSTKQAIKGFLYIAPWAAGFLLFIILPLIYCFYVSLCKFTVTGNTSFTGLKNYIFVLTKEPLFWIALRQSALWTLFNTLFVTFVSLLLAAVIFKGVRGVGTVRAIFYMPVVLSAIAITTIIRYLTRSDGWINELLAVIGFAKIDFWGIPINILLTILAGQIYFIGNTIILYLAGLSNISPEMYESADIDGAGAIRKFLNITVPMISPLIYFTVITSIIFTFSSYNIPLLYFLNQKTSQMFLGGMGNVMYHVGLLCFNYAFGFFKLGIASAIGWIMLLISFVSVALISKHGKRYIHYEGEI